MLIDPSVNRVSQTDGFLPPRFVLVEHQLAIRYSRDKFVCDVLLMFNLPGSNFKIPVFFLIHALYSSAFSNACDDNAPSGSLRSFLRSTLSTGGPNYIVFLIFLLPFSRFSCMLLSPHIVLLIITECESGKLLGEFMK